MEDCHRTRASTDRNYITCDWRFITFSGNEATRHPAAIDTRAGSTWCCRAGREVSRPAIRKEVTRVKKFLKWLDRFWFKLKIELETGFNKDRDS